MMPSEQNVKSQQNIFYDGVVSLFLDTEDQTGLRIIYVL